MHFLRTRRTCQQALPQWCCRTARTDRAGPRHIAPARGLAACAAWALAVCAHAQVHERVEGDYVLRANVVASGSLPPAMAQRHGLHVSPTRAVLNVVVQPRTGDGRKLGVPARVQADASDLLGATQRIELRPMHANEGVSYLGVFEHAPRQPLDFTVAATPSGSDTTLHLQFRERVWP